MLVEHETLYIFGKEVLLIERYGTAEKLVPLYIKFNKLDNEFVIVISFHESLPFAAPGRPPRYCFRAQGSWR